MMDNAVRNLRTLWRVETIIADIRLRQIMARALLRGLAALMGAFAYLMANLSLYLALERAWDSIWAAALVGLGNLLLALLLLVIAQRAKPGRELDLALQVRGDALRALEADAGAIQQQLVGFRDEIRDVRDAVAGFTRHPFETLLPSILVPLAGAVIKNLKKSDQS